VQHRLLSARDREELREPAIRVAPREHTGGGDHLLAIVHLPVVPPLAEERRVDLGEHDPGGAARGKPRPRLEGPHPRVRKRLAQARDARGSSPSPARARRESLQTHASVADLLAAVVEGEAQTQNGGIRQ